MVVIGSATGNDLDRAGRQNAWVEVCTGFDVDLVKGTLWAAEAELGVLVAGEVEFG